MSVTSASASDSMEQIIASMKLLSAAELFKLLKIAASEAEKKSKKESKTAAVKEKNTKAKVAKEKVTGAIPPQLLKPRAWVEFTLKDALANGWESFVIHQTHKDKETGEKIAEEIEMPASMLHDGAHVYEGSVTDANPTGRQLIHKDAMSLSKHRKTTDHPSYAVFEAGYVPPPPTAAAAAAGESSESDAASTSSKVIKMTAAEVEAKKAAKAAEKEAEKAAKAAEKEALKKEKALAKMSKEAEKAAEKAAKAAEKEAEKEAEKKTVKKTVKAKAKAKAKAASSDEE